MTKFLYRIAAFLNGYGVAPVDAQTFDIKSIQIGATLQVVQSILKQQGFTGLRQPQVQAQTFDAMYSNALTTSRMTVMCRRSPDFAGGMNGAVSAHSRSVTMLPPGNTSP